MVPYAFERGETISLALDVLDGDLVLVTAVTAKLKGAAARSPVAASFAVTPRAGAGDDPAGWTLTIDAEISAELEPGSYRADAMLEVSSGIVVTDPVAIRILEPVSVP